MADDNEQRRLMRIALVGIRPADQVTLKGYLRVLLRLDVELQWVAATDPHVDLFMINHEFRQAASVAKLLDNNVGTPVLYVQRSASDEGGLNQNLLVLPLKQISLLNDWLIKQVPLLRGSGLQMSAPVQEEQKPQKVEDLGALVTLIKELQQRKTGLFELCQGERVVAVIDTSRQRLWTKGGISKISADLRLRPYAGPSLDPKEAKDASHYLWLLACHNPEVLLPLIDNSQSYRLRFWAKPTTSHRRDFLQVMTALEKEACTPTALANEVGVSILIAKKVLAALLFSGNLGQDSYQKLSAPSAMGKAPTPTPSAEPINPTPTPKPAPPPKTAAPEQEEKMGFLSRLRRKLGL